MRKTKYILITFDDNKKLKIECKQSLASRFKKDMLNDDKVFVEIGDYQFNKSKIKTVSYNNFDF